MSIPPPTRLRDERILRPSLGESRSGSGPYSSSLPPFTCKQGVKAERVGFEPTRRFNTAYAISSPKTYVLARSILSAKSALLQGFLVFADDPLSVAY